MKINDFFEKEYLIAGNTYDNFVFEGCPDEFLNYAKIALKRSNGDVKPCVVFIDRKTEELVEQTLSHYDNEVQRQILARDFIVALVLQQVVRDTDVDKKTKNLFKLQIESFLSEDYKMARRLHAFSYMPNEVRGLINSVGEIELSFILNKTANVELQQAINNFLSAREPYSVKVFTNNDRLVSYYDQAGNIIESPHDFMRRDVNRFIEAESESGEE